MATSPVSDEPSAAFRMAAPATDADIQDNDPFRSVGPTHHRFSNFNSQLFALGPNASPAQAKRALEAHLAETDRRMEEAGKLGTALVQQRNELTERLKEVEKLQTEEELSDDLRQKLVEIEKDYNEVARESARAFLPKSRVPSNEAGVGSPFVPEAKGGKRSVSPSKFEAQATGSPTKLGVPNRKIRNQPSNRIHDIEFAAEISTSLIAQVRNLQALLAEKDEELKDIRLENSKLEYEVEGFQQRLKNLDDNEHRYKDENWSLETQVHDLMAKEKEAADRNKKLTQTLNILQAEKNAAQRELDEIKLSHSKLAEEHAAVIKHHDIELGTAKRTMVMGESERAAMQRKIDDLIGQNQELAKAVSASVRGRKLERESILGTSDEDFQTAHDKTTPEQSPPPSPIKSTPRHSMLESETLKTSLAHAQRTIQSLRTNVHREKTEKMETRRLLQEARDELERLRSDPLPPNRRARKTDSKEFKKPPRLLGALRSARSEIFIDDSNWEDQPEVTFHARSSPISRETTIFDPVPEHTDHFETANETSDAAFETANEIATETDDFHTGAEEFSSDDVETETESPSKRRTLTGRPPNLLGQRSMSVDSTASTEDEDFPYENDSRTPTSLPPLQAKFPLRVSRGAFRRSRRASEEPTFQSSPASFANSSNMGTPQKPAQSLAAELGDFDGSDNESNMSATPSRRSTRVRAMTPPPAMPQLVRVAMVDSCTMTEPLHELSPATPTSIVAPSRPISMDTVVSGFSMGSNYSDSGAQDLGDRLAEFPSPPTSPPKRDFPSSLELALSTMHSHHIEPLPEPDTHGARIAALRAEHAEQLKNLTAEEASARAAAVEVMKSEHADELSRAAAALKLAHAHEMANLRSDHLDATDRRIAEIQTNHALAMDSLELGHTERLREAIAAADAEKDRSRELWENKYELLKSTHVQELAQKETEMKEAFSAEIEALKVAHAEELSRKEFEGRTAYNAELEALKAAHAEELSRRERESRTAYDAEREAMKVAYAEELSQKESESKSTHNMELEALRAAHAEELSRKESENMAAYIADLEVLKARHVAELARKESESEAAYNADLETLKHAHTEELSRKLADLKATASTEVETLKTNHAEELSRYKTESEAVHAAELTALVEAHIKHVDTIEKDLSEAHARALEDLKSSHADQIDQVKQSMDGEHSEQFEAFKVSHLQQIDEAKNTINAAHSVELESLRAAHAQQVEDAKHEITTAHTTAIVALTDSHNRRLEDTEKSLQAAHSQELESLRAAHTKQQEDLGRKKDAAHAAAIATLVDSHDKQIDEITRSMSAAHIEAVENLRTSLAKQQENLGKERDAAHAIAIAALVESHTKQLETVKAEGEAVMSREIIALKDTHAQEIETLNSQHAAAHAKELDGFKAALAKQVESSKAEGDAAHSQQIEALNAAHAEIIEAHRRDSASAHSQALEALKLSYERQIDALKSEHTAARTKELELVTTKHLDELKGLRAENSASRTQELEELTNKHLDELKALKDEHETSKSQLLEELTSAHSKELDALRQELEDTHSKDLELVATKYANNLETLKSEHEATMAQRLQDLANDHSQKMTDIHREGEQAKLKELAALGASHAVILERINADHEVDTTRKLQEVTESHARDLKDLRQQSESDQSRALSVLSIKHQDALEKILDEHELTRQQELSELKSAHAAALASLRAEHQTMLEQATSNLKSNHVEALEAAKAERDISHSKALDTLRMQHSQQLDQWKKESDDARAKELDALKVQHAEILESHVQESGAIHARELDALKAQHAKIVNTQAQESEAKLSTELSALRVQHAQILESQAHESEDKLARELEALKQQHVHTIESLVQESNATLARELDATKVIHTQILDSHVQESEAKLARELDAVRAEHAEMLESHVRESTAEKESLLASHAAELEALRTSLAIVQPTLGYSSMSSIHTEPFELPEIKSPRREAFIIPQDREAVTPKARSNGGLIIAEDDTRQSPSTISRSETPDSQLPLKEITTNADARSLRKLPIGTSHQSSQTTLTGEALDKLMKDQRWQLPESAVLSMNRGEGAVTPSDEASVGSPSTVRIRRPSTDSLGSVTRARHRIPEGGAVAMPEAMPLRRPGSSASGRAVAQNRPPLPPNHREVIEAARTNSAHGGKGTMPPPLLPASAYRPQTPSNRPLSPTSVKGTLTPRVGRTPGHADVHSPTRIQMRSRQSSMSSFASEIDTRFNINNGIGMEAAGVGSSTDPRMIQAVTQTMIGEYLWKYTRKAGRGEMSENRHRRFFWVHPYTRALYWSDGDPATASRGEMKAKSVPIEAVRVVADDNPMPPGLHRKSLIVIAPGRTVKFTCTTGQRHETWFNALSYLLLRSGNEDKQEAESMTGNITQEDVEEFNPPMQRRAASGQGPRPPPSLSSYNSRTTRNDSPSLEVTMGIPTLTPTHEKEAARSGTLGRLSGYWRSSTLGRGTLSSLRGRGHQPYDSAIYEASEVNDSAEDLRQMIEQQDRESDRLENVRACCDGKHDVGTLPRTTKRGRPSVMPTQPHTHTHPGPSASQPTVSTTRSRA